MKPATRLNLATIMVLLGLLVVTFLVSGCTFHLHVLETGSTNDPVLIEWKDEITTQVNANTTRIAEEHPHGETEPDHPAE